MRGSAWRECAGREAPAPGLTAVVGLALASVAAAAPVGFRGDGSGVFDATPPLTWDYEQNVRWVVDTPGPSNASPIVVGRLVFACADPFTLLAYDADTGKLVWSRQPDPVDALPPPERARAVTIRTSARQAQAKLGVRREALGRVKRRLRQLGTTPALRSEVEALSREVNALKAEVDAAEALLPIGYGDEIGSSSPTPVSDGKLVFVVFRNGVVAAYDLAGRQHWIRSLGPVNEMMRGYAGGHAASPVLAGDRLLVAHGDFVALSAATGAELWRVPAFRDFGTPALGRVGALPIVVLPDGRVVGVEDGRVLATLPGSVWYVGPVVSGNTVFFAGSDNPAESPVSKRASIFGFALEPDGPGLRAKPLFTTALAPARHYAPPLLFAGRLHTVNQDGTLTVVDAATGAVRAVVELGLVSVMPSPVVAGGRLYVTDRMLETVVLSAGPKPAVLARNKLVPGRGTPFPHGRRLYVRSDDRLWCLEARR